MILRESFRRCSLGTSSSATSESWHRKIAHCCMHHFSSFMKTWNMTYRIVVSAVFDKIDRDLIVKRSWWGISNRHSKDETERVSEVSQTPSARFTHLATSASLHQPRNIGVMRYVCALYETG